MIGKKEHKIRFLGLILGCFFAVIGILGGFLSANFVYAEDPPNQIKVEETEMQPEEGEDSPNQIRTEETEMQPENQESEEGASADDDSSEVSEQKENNQASGRLLSFSDSWTGKASNDCEESLGELKWLVCPATEKIAEAVDWLYARIDGILKIDPVSMKDGSPVYEVWKYCLMVTNVLFIIFLLVVIYSQITGLGINNYGIKKTLPKMIVASVLINLSFVACSALVDVSNLVGDNLRGFFATVGEKTISVKTDVNVADGEDYSEEEKLRDTGFFMGLMEGSEEDYSEEEKLRDTGFFMRLMENNEEDYTEEEKLRGADENGYGVTGKLLGLGVGVLAFETGSIWMLIPVLLGALVSVVAGLITIAMRQAVVTLLIMISPLAMVAYILPNTGKWFSKWWDLLKKMLIFYPMFSFLFGASNLAGFAIIASANDWFGVMLGMAVQIFPLFYSWTLMRMSGTMLSVISAKMNGWMAKPLMASKMWAMTRKQDRRWNTIATGITPSARLMQYMEDRKVARIEGTKEHMLMARNRGLAYMARRHYKADGTPSREGERASEEQAKNMEYQRIILEHKNNLNKGLGQLEVVKASADVAQKVRLQQLDIKNVKAADALKVETARGQTIDYENAKGFHNRMEDAMNAHMDEVNGYTLDSNGNRVKRGDYAFHFDETNRRDNARRSEALERYRTASRIMEGNLVHTQFAAATAAQGYDTQRKIIESNMQKYFELLPPTQDVELRLNELTKVDVMRGQKAADNIDSVIAGLRVLNQRGDTDLLKKQIDNVLDSSIGGGIRIGTHASQALASFLMFEVKDSDPFLKRFGKYINLETARAYNINSGHPEEMRKKLEIDYTEYLKGYHEEPDGTRMYAKKDAAKLMEGTSFDGIERTAFDNFDASLKKAYGFDENNPDADWDFDGYLRRRGQIQTSIEPAFLSASQKWASGSEQMSSAVKFWTGYSVKQKKNGNSVETDEHGDPVYELSETWHGQEFRGHEEEMEKYYRGKTMDFFKDQTTGQIIGTRTDYRDPAVNHLVDQLLSEDEIAKDRYDYEVEQINSRYTDLDPVEAVKAREKDIKSLRIDTAGIQLRKILGATGKLGMLAEMKRSGVLANMKDWMRKMTNIDSEEKLKDEAGEWKKRNKSSGTSGTSNDGSYGAYDEKARENITNAIGAVFEENETLDRDSFNDKIEAKLETELGTGPHIIKALYRRYCGRNRTATNRDLYNYLLRLLKDPNNYK